MRGSHRRQPGMGRTALTVVLLPASRTSTNVTWSVALSAVANGSAATAKAMIRPSQLGMENGEQRGDDHRGYGAGSPRFNFAISLLGLGKVGRLDFLRLPEAV